MQRATLPFSFLRTDGYKFSMAQAGFPLRTETFYLSFRKGGWHYIPFDLDAEIRSMLDFGLTGFDFCQENGYGLTGAMESALDGQVAVQAAPQGTWVYEREPILTVTGPSFLVSWLEPLALRLFFPIQLATAIMKGEETPAMFLCTCEEQADIVRRVLEAVKRPDLEKHIKVEAELYRDGCLAQAKSLIEIVKDPARLFEVGMRASTCEEQRCRSPAP